MLLPIKKALLEGYTLEAIVEAVHANHPQLDKRRLKDPATSYKEGKEIVQNRKKLTDNIKTFRGNRDITREFAAEGGRSADNVRENTQSANYWDNHARAISQTGGESVVHTAELKNIKFPKSHRVAENVPRVISSAKK